MVRRLGADYVEIRQPSPSINMSALGFVPSEQYSTFRIDLTQGETTVWRRLDKKCRNAIRRSNKSGVRIVPATKNLLEVYYDLYLNTQKKHGSPPHSATLFFNLVDALNTEKQMQMVLALYDGRAIGGIIVFCLNGKMYWWGSVVDRKYAPLNPTNSLLWHVIQWGTNNNYKSFELGRTRSETKGIYLFKKGWGGLHISLTDYILATKNVKLPDPIQKKYVMLSEVWSLLPSKVAQQLGPSIVSRIGL